MALGFLRHTTGFFIQQRRLFDPVFPKKNSVYIASDELMSGFGIDWTAADPEVGVRSPADIYQNASNWQNLTNEECMRAYGQLFVSSRSNVLAMNSGLKKRGGGGE